MQSECREARIDIDEGLLEVNIALWENLYDQAKYAEAESISFDLLEGSREIGDYKIQVIGLRNVARAQYQQGKVDMAEINLRYALGLVSRHWEESDPWILEEVVHTKSLIQDWGLQQRAAELGVEIERMMVLNNITDDT